MKVEFSSNEKLFYIKLKWEFIHLYRFMQTIPINQNIRMDNYNGSNILPNPMNESNIGLQFSPSDTMHNSTVHPQTLQISSQPNQSLVSTPTGEYTNQQPHFPVLTDNMQESSILQHQLLQQNPIKYSDTVKQSQPPQPQGNLKKK